MIKIILTVVLSIILLFILSIFVTKLDNGEYKNIFSNKIIQKFTGFSILLVMIALIIKFKLLTGVLGMTLTSIGFILVTYLVWNLFIKSK
jgi:VIT1/CCC1 family predicted Fe2+/Mn2+ transporter